jgi:hypothetical protein
MTNQSTHVLLDLVPRGTYSYTGRACSCVREEDRQATRALAATMRCSNEDLKELNCLLAPA